MIHCFSWILREIALLLLIYQVVIVSGNYDVKDDLRSPLRTPYRTMTASFVRNHTLYFWGGTGSSSISTDSYYTVAPYFESVQLDPNNGDLIYSTVENSKNYTNYTIGAAAVLLPDNERVLFFGGFRGSEAVKFEDELIYIEQYDFRTSMWTSLPVQLEPSVNQSIMPPRNRKQLSAALAPNGKVYLAGGRVTTSSTSDYDIWVYDLNTSSFTPIEEGGWLSRNASALSFPFHGTVVLPDGRIAYVTDVSNHVRILDTNTNTVYLQDITGYETIPGGGMRGLNISHMYTDVRFYGHAFLAPNNRYIYLYGGCNRYDHFESCKTGVAILDTVTWSWIAPKNILGPTPNARYMCTSAIINDSYMIITHGITVTSNWLNDFNVLRLPEPSDPTGDFAWVSNITHSNDVIVRSLQEGDKPGYLPNFEPSYIAGVAIGSVFILILLIYLIYRWGYKLKSDAIYICKYYIWERRTGEPRWVELSHLISRIILVCLFIAYVGYSIMLISKSPISMLTITKSTDNVPFPGILHFVYMASVVKYLRICFEGIEYLEYFNCESGPMDTLDFVEQGFFQRLDSNGISKLDNDSYSYNMNGITNCWLFTPPSDYRLSNSGTNDGGQLRFLFDLVAVNESNGGSINIELYPHGRNPNLAVYNGGTEQRFLSKLELKQWLRTDSNDMQMANHYRLEYNSYTSISYEIPTHKSLTTSLWNSVGIAPIYESVPNLVTTYKSNTLKNDSHAANSIDIYPISMTETTLQDQRIYTLLTVIGPASGMFALLVALDSVLFGYRPRSPWGVFHRFGGRRLRHSLLNHLYDRFGGLQQPIPLINPVNEQSFSIRDGYHWNSEKQSYSPISLWKHQHQNDELIDVKRQLTKTTTRLHELERRTQLMEIVFKTYYVDDEIFYNLYNAHELNNSSGINAMDNSVGEGSITVIDTIDSLSSPTRSSSRSSSSNNSLSAGDEKRNSIIGRKSIKNWSLLRGLRQASENTESLERQNSDDLSDATFTTPPPSVRDSNEERRL
ncbi:hypothetical protein BDC45DRAFT_582719 [Circinella umbellata]|nr:hypothetical protein BDC45DRAFT_582719 [Circinella umbellata]